MSSTGWSSNVTKGFQGHWCHCREGLRKHLLSTSLEDNEIMQLLSSSAVSKSPVLCRLITGAFDACSTTRETI